MHSNMMKVFLHTSWRVCVIGEPQADYFSKGCVMWTCLSDCHTMQRRAVNKSKD